MTTERLSAVATLNIYREIEIDKQEVISHARRQEYSILYKDYRLKTSIVLYYSRDTCSLAYNNWVERMFVSDYSYLDYFNSRYQINTIWTS